MYRREQGQSLVEFALLWAVLILIFLGIFDVGRACNAYIVVTNYEVVTFAALRVITAAASPS